MVRIAIGERLHSLVNACDLRRLSEHRWYAVRGPWTTYVMTKIRGKTTYMHRFILSPPKDKTVDHINGNGMDNRRCNLRLATVSEQGANAKPKKKRALVCSSYKGVSWHNTKTGGCWRAELEQKTKGKRKRYIKYASTQEQAALLYNTLARKHFGVFARINEII